MKNLIKNFVLCAFVTAPFALTGCARECVDFADCADKAKAENKDYTCEEGVCKPGSPFPDAGSAGGGSGGGSGGGAGGGTGGGMSGGGTGGGDMGGGAGGGTGGGGDDDAGMGGGAGGGGGDDDAGMGGGAGGGGGATGGGAGGGGGEDDAGMGGGAGGGGGAMGGGAGGGGGAMGGGAGGGGGDDDGGMDAGIDAGVVDAGDPATEITIARAYADGGVMMPVDISSATVTYLRPTIGSETAGFFVQTGATGPAIFVLVDPTTLSPAPQVGDQVAFTSTAYSTLGGLAQITAISNWQRLSTGGSVTSLAQDLTASATISADLNDLESELISIRGVLDGGFTNASAPFVGAIISTPANPSANVRFRIPQPLVDAADLERGCDITVGPTPMWRNTVQPQPSAWTASDFTINSCPAPTVVSAAPSSPTTVVVTFSRHLSVSSVNTDGTQFTFNNGLTASNAVVNGKTVTLTTSTQTGGQAYLLTVAASVTDQVSAPVGTPNTAAFQGFLVPAVVRINELNANIANGCDLIELRVVSGGTMNGYYLRERDTGVLVTFANFSVAKNDIIVVHINGGSANCNVGGGTNETTGPAQQPAATFTKNYDSAFDWYSSDNGLVATDNVITLYNNLDVIMDAVLIDDDVTGSNVATGSETQAATVAAAMQWQIVGGGVPTGGFVDDNFRLNAVLNSLQTGTTAATPTLQRIDNTDDNDKADWNSAPAGVAQSWGVLNAGQTAFP